VDTVVLDKTGTVTSGRMTVTEVLVATGEEPDRVLALAAAVEDASEHPIGRAVARAARAPHPPVESFRAWPGKGASGVVESRAVLVGSPELLADWSVRLGPELDAAVARAQAHGATPIAVAWDGQARGVIVVTDAIRPTSVEAVSQLRALGLEPVLLTGDHDTVAREVAAQVGIDTVVSRVLPTQKVAEIEALQARGKVVAMVGDGVNDAAALAQADLGIAMGSGTDAAIEASDLTLVRADLRGVVDAIRLSRATLRTIRGNLFWAFAYNVAAIPLAAFGLLNPMIAGAAMAASSVFVVGNSLRLRRFRSIDTTVGSHRPGEHR
jgi:Cu+-exporting ATPase